MSQNALMQAVRTAIRASAGFEDRQVNIEPSLSNAPAITGDLYVIIAPGPYEDGPVQATAGGVYDFLYGVDVAIVKRAQVKPADLRREMLTDLTNSFEIHVRDVRIAVDFQYDVVTTANGLITTWYSEDGFISPPVLTRVGPITKAPATLFRGVLEEEAALMRVMEFRNARRIWER